MLLRWLLVAKHLCHLPFWVRCKFARVASVKKRAHAIYTRFFHISFWVFQLRLFIFPFSFLCSISVFFRFFLAVSRIRFAYFSRLLTNLIYLRLVCFSFCFPLLSPLLLFRSFYALLSLPVLITHNARIYLTLAIYTARY